MARIREYEQQIGASGEIGGRRATPADAFSLGDDAGRALSSVADVMQDTAERQEVSDIQAKLAKARAEWTVHLAERAQASSPGDATFASKFNEDFTTYLQQIEAQPQTRAGQMAFKKGAAELSAHFVEKSGVYQAAAMGAKAKQDYLVALDSFRNVLLTDPTQFSAIEKSALDSLNDPTGIYAKMPAAEREKLVIATRQQLAMSAVQGLIQNGAPELAKKQLQDGKWDSYLDADKKKDLVDNADVGIRAKDTAAERQRMLAEREKRDRQDATMSAYLARIIDPKANGGALSDREVLANTELTAMQKQHMIEYKRARAKELMNDAENRKNPMKVRELINEIIAADGDESKVFSLNNTRQAYRENKISTNELTFIEGFFGRLKDGSTNTFARDMNSRIATVERMVAGSIEFTGRTAEAIQTVNQIRFDAFETVEQWRRDNKNPRDLLNPASKDYLFSPEKLQTYIKGSRAALADDAGRVRTPQYTVGQVYNFAQGSAKYKGGDPKQASSWEPINSQPIRR